MIEYIPVKNLGKNRDSFLAKVNKKIGKGNWFWAFRSGSKLISWSWGMQLYEDAYWQYMRKNVSIIKKLVDANNVYVYTAADIDSLLDFKKQDNAQDHYSDIAIRRCMVRFGLWFNGKKLFPITDSELDDGNVPFHLPHLINNPNNDFSAKSWLFNNRMIAVAKTMEDKIRLSELLIK